MKRIIKLVVLTLVSILSLTPANAKQYLFQITQNPFGQGNITQASIQNYSGSPISFSQSIDEGKVVEITMTPASGWKIIGFTINNEDTMSKILFPKMKNTYEVTMNKDISVVVTYAVDDSAVKYPVNFSINDPDAGTIGAYALPSYEIVTNGQQLSKGTRVRVEAKVNLKEYKVVGFTINGESVPEDDINSKREDGEMAHYIITEVPDGALNVVCQVESNNPNIVKPVITYSTENPEMGTIKVYKAKVVDGNDQADTNEPIGSGSKVSKGQRVAVIASPKEGYQVSHFVINGTETEEWIYYENVPNKAYKYIDITKNQNIVVVFKSAKSIDNAHINECTIYPNPAKHVAYVTNAPEGQKVEVFTLSGQLIYRTMANNEGLVSINTANLNNGLYIVKVSTRTLKLMVNR